ncbi:hypothetical protein ACS0TY_020567 [Phlomoides rotata]
MYLTLDGDTFRALPPLVSAGCFLCVWTALTLGYYLLWSLFSLSHHVMVWMAACLARFDRKLKDYALLGDDIIIANERVSLKYAEIVKALGVSISGEKSIISKIGSFEFAKQFWVKKGSMDLSPVSLRSIFQARSVIGLRSIRSKYGVSPKCLLQLAGAGYHVMAKLDLPYSHSYVYG